MTIQFSSFSKKASEVEEHLSNDLSTVRTGRATPAILDNVLVEAYGTLVKIREVGAIGVEDASTIRVTPWEAPMGKLIETAIQNANLGVAVSADDKGVRVTFPSLTADRRQSLMKVVKEKLEISRVSLRALRDKEIADLEAKEKGGGFGKDEIFRAKQELQKVVDAFNKKLQDLADKKEKEITN